MKLLFVADGSSPIARSWIGYFIEGGHEVHLASTRPMPPMGGLASTIVAPVAFSGLGGGDRGGATAARGATPTPGAVPIAADTAAINAMPAPGAVPIAADTAAINAMPAPAAEKAPRPSWLRSATTIGLRTAVRHWLGPLTVGRAGRRLRSIIDQLQPELIHAMRIPFEGALAAAAGSNARLIVSTWGNDLTLHAPAAPLMRRMTRTTLQRADALHTDCRRDLRLAGEWGFDPAKPNVVLPGNGGVRRELFHPGPPGQLANNPLSAWLDTVPDDAPVVLNPRGFRAYVRNDTFFRAVPLVLRRQPQARFACAAMAGERRAERWIERTGTQAAVSLLPKLQPADLALLMRRAQVMVSPSEHDGTPNTLLEAMACGVYPVLGKLESVAEWIDDGSTGTLVDAGSPEQLAQAIVNALADPQRLERAAQHNQAVIAERADYSTCMAQAEGFYQRVLAG